MEANDDYDDLENTWKGIIMFLVFSPVLVIPIFWIAYLATNHTIPSMNLLFIILFVNLLALIPILFIIAAALADNNKMDYTISVILLVSGFYGPNFLQTLLILLMRPINFYFVKTCVFVLVLSLTRNISYFTDEIPRDFLATSTAFVQYIIRNIIDETRSKNVDKPINVNIV